MKNLPPVDPQSYQPLREQVYTILRKGILGGRLTPGEQITEVAVAETFRVSRTPAREAIRMLEQEGLIVIVPRRGAFVTGIKSEKEIQDIFQVRIVLEGVAAAAAAERISASQIAEMRQQIEEIEHCLQTENVKSCIAIDTAFHRLICRASGNEVLEKILDQLFEQITRFRAASLGGGGRLQEALAEHRALYEAIVGGHREQARLLAERHLENARDRVLAVFRQQHEQL